ncbi:MAG: helix-turn-helix transcriptional regulator [Lentisphaeria bacterium]|nr:AraC family transcriptional regulator [Lentisphaeria bacterium]NQZ67185.1 helix-turn-helix transcriptional regulator [Lentisphaeria bacterium]
MLLEKLQRKLEYETAGNYVQAIPVRPNLPAYISTYAHEYWGPGHLFEHLKTPKYSIEFIQAGSCLYRSGEAESLVQAGEIYILRAGVSSYYTSKDYALKRYINIEGPELINYLRMFNLHNQDHIVLSDPHYVRNLYKKIKDCTPMEPSQRVYEQAQYLHELLSYLGKQVGEKYPKILHDVLNAMSTNLHDNLEISDMCAIAKLGQSALFKLFKDHLKQSPISYYRALKMDVAAGLLANTQQKITVISDQLGFQNPLYFSTTFKKIKGQSPRDFRNESQQG